jgi:hypothetical protein
MVKLRKAVRAMNRIRNDFMRENSSQADRLPGGVGTMNESSSARDPLEELVEEFVARARRGEHLSLSEYTDKYPHLAKQIRELFPALVVMEQFGSIAGAPTGPFQRRAEGPAGNCRRRCPAGC